MAKKDDAAAKAAADRRQAERDQRMKTGKAVRYTPPPRWFKSRAKSN
jgi:hypothetical protein